MWVEKLTKWAGKNQDKIYSFECILHAFVGLILMLLAYHMGHTHISLLQDGVVKAQGRIVDYKEEAFTTTSGTSNTSVRHGTKFMPIIEFKVEDRVIRFRDWIGSQSNSVPVGGDSVPVIYSTADPSVAMIDRPILNWVLWAPIFIAGLFLVLVSIKNWLKSGRAEPHLDLNKVETKLTDTDYPIEFPDADDPIAHQVSWNPANPGGANFKTQELKVAESQIVIKQSVGAILFGLFFAVLGLVGQMAGGLLIFLNGQIVGGLFMVVLGVIFDGVALLLLIGGKKITFDKLPGVYFRGNAFDHSKSVHRYQQGRLTDIHAIQLINERIHSNSNRGDTSAYTSHEINLVFKDGDRLNVMDHGKEQDVVESARQLGKFLGVPIWKVPSWVSMRMQRMELNRLGRQ